MIKQFFALSKLIFKYKFKNFNTSTARISICTKKQYNTETIKPKLNKNLGLPWTLQGEKASGNHQIL